MTLSQAIESRLADMRYVFAESGITEMTGKLRYHAGTREVAGRFGGVKKAFPVPCAAYDESTSVSWSRCFSSNTLV